MMDDLAAMGAFALTLSISPGPVNMITLASGTHYGPRRTMPFVIGASVGFTALLVAVGLAASSLAGLAPVWHRAMTLAGAAIIIYFGVRLAFASAGSSLQRMPPPTLVQGLALQWVNPKAVGACLGAVSLFELAGHPGRLAYFSSLYFVMCLIGVSAWAFLGRGMQRFLSDPVRIRIFNGLLGGTLILVALALTADAFL